MDKIKEEGCSRHYSCATCIQDRRTYNIIWALEHLKFIGITNANALPWQLLLGYGQRMHNSQALCEDCQSSNKENLLHE